MLHDRFSYQVVLWSSDNNGGVWAPLFLVYPYTCLVILNGNILPYVWESRYGSPAPECLTSVKVDMSGKVDTGTLSQSVVRHIQHLMFVNFVSENFVCIKALKLIQVHWRQQCAG